jgi:GNAT superfamily N-acetyltransferase
VIRFHLMDAHAPTAISIAVLRTPEQFALFHAVQTEYEATLPGDLQHELPGVDVLPQVYAEPNAAFLGFVDDDPAGSIAAIALDDATDVLQRLYVRPAFRNAGLARALVAAVIDRARVRGRARIVLDTDRDRMATAYRLYRSFGFEECAPYGAPRPGCPTYMELTLDRSR